MNYFWAFVTGGAICVVGQLFLDLTALTPARIGCRHHHQPCLRRGLFAGGPQPRPELKQNSSWDDTLFSCIVLFCAHSSPLHGILFQKRR